MTHPPNLDALLAIVVGLRDHAQGRGEDGERLAQRIDLELRRAGLDEGIWMDINAQKGFWRERIWAGVEH